MFNFLYFLICFLFENQVPLAEENYFVHIILETTFFILFL